MKKVCITIGLMLALASCSKDEINTFEYHPKTVEETPEIKNIDSIVGNWKYPNGNLQILSNNGAYVKVRFDEEYHYKGGTWEKISEDTYLLNWSDNEGSHTVTYDNVTFNGNQMTYNDTITVTRY